MFHERREQAGELLRETVMHEGGRPKDKQLAEDTASGHRLEDLGICRFKQIGVGRQSALPLLYFIPSESTRLQPDHE